jgi:hypothetical protein
VRDVSASTTRGGRPDGSQLRRDYRAISDDGRHVAFARTRPTRAGRTNGKTDVFLRDRTAGRRSASASIRPACKAIRTAQSLGKNIAISGNGRYVAFNGELRTRRGDVNNASDIFVRDASSDDGAREHLGHGRRPNSLRAESSSRSI